MNCQLSVIAGQNYSKLTTLKIAFWMTSKWLSWQNNNNPIRRTWWIAFLLCNHLDIHNKSYWMLLAALQGWESGDELETGRSMLINNSTKGFKHVPMNGSMLPKKEIFFVADNICHCHFLHNCFAPCYNVRVYLSVYFSFYTHCMLAHWANQHPPGHARDPTFAEVRLSNHWCIALNKKGL